MIHSKVITPDSTLPFNEWQYWIKLQLALTILKIQTNENENNNNN